jgi:hypothetical protein
MTAAPTRALKEDTVGRLCMTVLALIAAYFLAPLTPVMAQPRDSWGSLVGNWKLEFFDKDRKPLAHGVFAFHPGPINRYAGGLVMEATGPYKAYGCQGSLKAGTAELGCGTYGFSTHFDHLTLQSADGKTLSGTWRWAAKEPEGFVRGVRPGSPTIDKVEVSSVDGPPTASGEKTVDHLRVRLYGRDLPNWLGTTNWEDLVDRRVFRMELLPVADISIDDPKFRVVPLNYRTLATGWSADHLDVIVRLQPGARPGRKTITVNGSRTTFDAMFTAIREASKVVELKFVRKDGSALTEIGYGEPFRVEARFDVPPPEAERIVKLDWGGGTRDIAVVKQPDAKVFRSGLLYLEAPTDAAPKR